MKFQTIFFFSSKNISPHINKINSHQNDTKFTNWNQKYQLPQPNKLNFNCLSFELLTMNYSGIMCNIHLSLSSILGNKSLFWLFYFIFTNFVNCISFGLILMTLEKNYPKFKTKSWVWWIDAIDQNVSCLSVNTGEYRWILI